MVRIVSDQQLGKLSSNVHIVTDEQLKYGVPTRLDGRMLITLTDFMRWRMRHGGAVADVPNLDVVYFTSKGSLQWLSQWAISKNERANLRDVVRKAGEAGGVEPRRPGTAPLLRLLLADHASRALGVRSVFVYTHDFHDSPTHLLRTALANPSRRTGAPYISNKIRLLRLIRSQLDPVTLGSHGTSIGWPSQTASPTGYTVWDTNAGTRRCDGPVTTFLLTPAVELEIAKHILWPPDSVTDWVAILRNTKIKIQQRQGFVQLPEFRQPMVRYLATASWSDHLPHSEYMDQMVLATCLTGIESKPLHGICTRDGAMRIRAEAHGISLH